VSFRPPLSDSGAVYLMDCAASPPWSGQSGQYGFRHWGPPAGQKQGNVPAANFLFIDGHVTAMPFDGSINLPERFNPK